MKSLKICMVTTFYPPYNFGGDGFLVHRFANALARRGHRVHVIHDLDAFALLTDHQPKPAMPGHANILLHPLTSRGVGSLDVLLSHQLGRPVIKGAEIQLVLEEENFDVVHFHNISLLGGPAVLNYGSALRVCSMHDYWSVCAMHVLWRFSRAACTRRTCLACTVAGGRPPQLWRYTGGFARAAQNVDAFIVPSQSSREHHRANGFPAPMRVLPYFMPDDEAAAAAETSLASPHPRPYFLFVGRLEKIKGLQDLIAVFAHYRAADLVIAGRGNYMPQLRRQADGLPHVHFLGELPHSRLRALYRHAIASVVPSLCYETFGWITLESFVLRTPVIVRDIGALPEVVNTGGGGIVYRTNEELIAALELLRGDSARRQVLGEEGYQSYLDHFTEERHVQTYLRWIEELQAARQAGPA